MRVAIIGRTKILLDTAKSLHQAGHEIGLVVTSKEAPEYSVTTKDFEAFAREINVPFILTQNIRNTHPTLTELEPFDIAVSINFTGVIPQETIDFFKLGILNAHGGDLPRYRGNACQAWAIIAGEKHIGLCIHKMIGGELDSGQIIGRKFYPINLNTKIGDVLDWIEKESPSMFLQALEDLKTDPGYVLEVQSIDPKDALRCYPRMPEDGKIDWKKSNIDILRLINASNKPYAGAFCSFDDEPFIIWDARLAPEENFLAIPGQITKIENGSVEVATGSGKLTITSVEYRGQVSTPDQIIKSIRKRLK